MLKKSTSCLILFAFSPFLLNQCKNINNKDDNSLICQQYNHQHFLEISRGDYANRLYGFWLGQCIANWTGLITEMDKIGGEGINGRGAGFYTRKNWGGPDHPNIWNSNSLKDTIGYYFEEPGGIWGADDDTDIEYLYQHLMYTNQTATLTPIQIRDGWLQHIRKEEENFLWVSNQAAFDLMREGVLPPHSGDPQKNPYYEMIDAQLTTEIFGLFAPGRPDIAIQIATLPIQTTARENAEWIARFYVTMHAAAPLILYDSSLAIQEKVLWLSDFAKDQLPDESYARKMYDFVLKSYQSGIAWEETRNALHEKYQVRQEDGYQWASKDTVCNGCFAAGINFAAGMISLFYGAGDIKETIKIGSLVGWDSDNPTATWGGLLGFLLGKDGVEKEFNRTFANRFNIHRTRVGFANGGIETFEEMASKGIQIIDLAIREYGFGEVDMINDQWLISTETGDRLIRSKNNN